MCTLTTLMLCTSVAADTLQEVMDTLNGHAVVRANYEQRKHGKGQTREFRSSGVLVFVRHQGVLLAMSTPAVSQLVMTQAMILQRSTHQTTRFKLDQGPIGAAATVFGQLASGDVRQLQQSFVILAISTRDRQWQLQLTPRTARLKKSLVTLRLSGGEFLREIEINDTRGGQVVLQLSNHQTQPDHLSADELELFELAQ